MKLKALVLGLGLAACSPPAPEPVTPFRFREHFPEQALLYELSDSVNNYTRRIEQRINNLGSNLSNGTFFIISANAGARLQSLGEIRKFLDTYEPNPRASYEQGYLETVTIEELSRFLIEMDEFSYLDNPLDPAIVDRTTELREYANIFREYVNDN